MNHEDRIRIRFMILAALAIMIIAVFTAGADSRELPEIVSPSQLGSTWDNRRVAIFGYAQSCEPMRGRLGSNNIKCVVSAESGEVTVYTDFQLYGVVGEQVIVQGVYKEHGRYGGLLADHFIVADAIIRDWDN